MSQKSHVYLTPATKDKAGEVVEVIENYDAPQMYAEPVSYAVNDAEINRLRKAVTAAGTALRHATSRHAPAPEIARLEQALASVKQELDAAEAPHRQQRARETGVGRDTSPLAHQTLAELVKATGASVAALMKKSPLACNASPRCTPGPGKYLCPRCKAAV